MKKEDFFELTAEGYLELETELDELKKDLIERIIVDSGINIEKVKPEIVSKYREPGSFIDAKKMSATLNTGKSMRQKSNISTT